jgi:PAS domain S-box-containing protein
MAQVRAMVRIKQAEDSLRGENRSLERAVAERTGALEESRRLLAAIVDGTPDAIWVKDLEGRYLLANAAKLRTLGRPAAEVLGRTAAELADPEAAPEQEAADRRVLEGGETLTTEEQRLGAGGRRRAFVAVRGPVRDVEGRISGLFAVVRDITDRARARLVLQKETERVQALLALYREPGASAGEVLRAAAQGLTTLTGSELGLVGIPTEDGAALQAHAWSSRPLELVGPEGKAFLHRLRPGDPLAEVLRTGQPAVLDTPQALALAGLPAGHPALRRLLAMPVVRDGRVVLVGGVANRDEPYGELDVAQAGLYLEGAWEALRKVQAEEQRAALHEQLRQAAKMEAVGRLAGGVAHDFNNLLSVILSYSRFALESMGEADPLRQDLEEIRQAGERAAALTRQLLAHSRKQVLQVSTLDLNEVVTGIEPMLRRLLGEDLELRLELAARPWPVRADRGQLEQVVVNLAVNARDAMPDGGRVTIRTANLVAGAEPGPAPWSAACALLEVADTGIGMDEPTRARVFEPFFTTKEPGKGTGLGLATVYGIVKQSGGDVRVESSPGGGSTFRLALPAAEGAEALVAVAVPLAASPPPAPGRPRPGGQETVLVVEDEAAVRALAGRILAGAGYRVLAAASGAEALALPGGQLGEVRLLLTDVVMPQMSGHALAERLKGRCPGLEVVYMSGYLDDALGQRGVLPETIRFIGKPFAAPDLLRLVRETLDRAAAAPGAVG